MAAADAPGWLDAKTGLGTAQGALQMHKGGKDCLFAGPGQGRELQGRGWSIKASECFKQRLGHGFIP